MYARADAGAELLLASIQHAKGLRNIVAQVLTKIEKFCKQQGGQEVVLQDMQDGVPEPNSARVLVLLQHESTPLADCKGILPKSRAEINMAGHDLPTFQFKANHLLSILSALTMIHASRQRVRFSTATYALCPACGALDGSTPRRPHTIYFVGFPEFPYVSFLHKSLSKTNECLAFDGRPVCQLLNCFQAAVMTWQLLG